MTESKEQEARDCCFCQKLKTSNDIPSLSLEIALHNDKYVVLWAHEHCFNHLRNRSVLPDKPEEHGNIPKNAKCVFCGNKLPIIGRHPYCFNLGKNDPPVRYWSHVQCMSDRIKPSKKELLLTNQGEDAKGKPTRNSCAK